MRENRDAIRTSLSFVAGALCGAGIAALFDGRRGAERRKWLQSRISGSPMVNEQILSGAELASLVREQLRDICDADNLSIEVNEGHVTVWRGITYEDAASIAERLGQIPLISSFYVQPDDTRHMREFQDEQGIAVRELARDEQLLAS